MTTARHSLGVMLLIALGSAASTSAAEPSFAIAVHFNPPERSVLVMQEMTSEASSIWAPYGVRFVWSTDGDGTEAPGVAEVAGSFEVTIQRARNPAYAAGGVVLGVTRVPHRRIDRVPVTIDRDGVEELLRSLQTDRAVALVGHQTVGSIEVGRALGRVLAHEVGHVLLAQGAHRPDGLMRASYRVEDLAALRRDSFALSPVEVDRLHARLDALLAGPGMVP